MKRMQSFLRVALALVLLAGCKGNKGPDVSAVKVPLQTQRFEQDFFAIDTNDVSSGLQQLHQKYPGFLQDFLFNILALPAQPDSLQVVEDEVKLFVRSYKPVKDSADVVFKNFSAVESEIKTGLQHVGYYFPTYKIPAKIITFIGPINSYGNILTADAIAIGLQLYMGKDYTLYQSEAGQQLYPLYISRRFQPEYIAASSIKNIVDDIYPDNSSGKPLVQQMIEAGKRLYVLDKLLPETADTIKTGYTQAQLQGAYNNEAFIWSFFVQNDLLFATDPGLTKDYMTDGPKTPVLGEASPGFIGQFVGWQIVKKWMSDHEDLPLNELLSTDARKIYEEAKYKPR